jgi:hypothetical protein
LSLQTARKGGSLTSSIGASNKGNSGSCILPIEGMFLLLDSLFWILILLPI